MKQPLLTPFEIAIYKASGNMCHLTPDEHAIIDQLRTLETRHTYYNLYVRGTHIQTVANNIDELVAAVTFFRRCLDISASDLHIERKSAIHTPGTMAVLAPDDSMALVIDGGDFVVIIL